ncbi:MAG: hypothetical protein P1P86_00165 [Bacteroidales bacterium]|nr:hypothetical protein [Bacteroidales bacterium]
MIFQNLSVRSKLILTTLFLVLVMIILALIYMDASRRLETQAELLNKHSGPDSSSLSLQNSSYAMDEELPDPGKRSPWRRNWQLGLAMALGIFLLASFLVVFAMYLGKSFTALSRYTRKLSKGTIPPHQEPGRQKAELDLRGGRTAGRGAPVGT